MRKVILLLCCMMLVACQGKQESHSPISQQVSKEDLVLKQWKYLSYEGDGNDDGYYRLLRNDDGYTNILYTDYSTGKEVYLCNKPECHHKDDTCTSYLNNGDIAELFVYKDHLYLIENSASEVMVFNDDGSSTTKKQTGPCIYQMDLDGQNKKEIYQLKEGYSFETGDLVLDGNDLYLSITKEESIEVESHSHMQVQTSNELYKIDLENGQAQKMIDLYDGLSDRNISAVDGRKIILSGYYCQEDPQKYLDKQDYDGYDKAMMNSQPLYEVYDIDTQEKQTFQLKNESSGEYYHGKLYSLDEENVEMFDLSTQKTKKLLSLPKGYTYNSDLVNNWFIIHQWKDQKFQKTYYINLDNPNLKELKQYTKAPKEPVSILSVGTNQLFVMYDRDGGYEKTWAGTMQYEVKKEYRGLISFDDFFNNQKNYKKVSMIEG